MSIKDSAKTILCYGDSNTWGNVPRSDDRYARSVRWPSVLQKLLGDDYEVISEGLPGRTFVAMDGEQMHKTGITYLQTLLESHDPVDLIIVMLGTNDVKTTYNLTADEIAQDLEETIFTIRSKKLDLEKAPKILIICPPPVTEPSIKARSKKGQGLDETMVRGIEIFKTLPSLFKEVAERHECYFLNAGDFIRSSKVDGYHLDKESHLKLAEVLKGEVLKMNL